MRTFMAIELPPGLRQSLVQVQERLDGHLPQGVVVWTAPRKLHLTLRFLGETDPAQQAQLAGSLAALARRLAPFPLALQGIGVFPDYGRMRVVWVGLSGALTALGKLNERIEQLAREAGFEAETKPFSPHITIGRTGRNVSGPDLRQAGRRMQELARAPEAEQMVGEFVVSEVVHMQSQLRPGGAVYAPLGRFPFMERHA
jgi:RNA 2',3'-cyclic 3'-phosphodiesterase